LNFHVLSGYTTIYYLYIVTFPMPSRCDIGLDLIFRVLIRGSSNNASTLSHDDGRSSIRTHSHGKSGTMHNQLYPAAACRPSLLVRVIWYDKAISFRCDHTSRALLRHGTPTIQPTTHRELHWGLRPRPDMRTLYLSSV